MPLKPFLASSALVVACLETQAAPVINEIHYDPEPKTEFLEFIELHNPGPDSIDLSGWTFADGVVFTFPDGTLLDGNAFLLIAEDPSALAARFQTIPEQTQVFQFNGSLANHGEKLDLRDGGGATIDVVDYRSEFPWPIAPNGEGDSMQLINPGLDNDLGGAWRAGLPTPGLSNGSFADNAPPLIRHVEHAPQSPASDTAITISAKVTDSDGVAAITLLYQIVRAGRFIPAYLPNSFSTLVSNPDAPLEPNPDFDNPANWTSVPMIEDGTGTDTYAAQIPAQGHRTLVRYRISAEDATGASIRVPYPDDRSLNFAYFVYDGVPPWTASRNSVHPEGAPHTYSAEVLTALPVYTMITRNEDRAYAYAYTSTGDGGFQIAKGSRARQAYNWECALVYDGVVYDHVGWRLRQNNDRYAGNGKRSMRFRLNRGHYFQARDENGEKLAVKWRRFSTSKMSRFGGTNSFGLHETINSKLWRMVGVECPYFLPAHFRMIDGPREYRDQYDGDFFGLTTIVQDIDGRLLDDRNLPNGNIYKLRDGVTSPRELQRNQSRTATTDGRDFLNIKNNLSSRQSDRWLRTNVHWDQWARYHAVVEAVRHYDFGTPSTHFKNRAWYFQEEPGTRHGLLRIIPHDHDASWLKGYHDSLNNVGNSIGTGFPWAAIFDDIRRPPTGTEKADFTRDYRNFLREFRDLLWHRDTVNALIDDHVALLKEFSLADRDRWTRGPAEAGVESMTAIENVAGPMKEIAFLSDTVYGANLPGGRAAFLDQIATEPAIPDRPAITYSGPPEFPAGGLQFTSSAFSDPQGPDTFGKMEWRIAEVSGRPDRRFEWFATWESGEIDAFQSTITPPALATRPDRRYRARVRHADHTGHWSHWSEPVEFTATQPDLSLYLDSLVISEIMYHPANPSAAEQAAGYDDDDFFEFIELRNVGSQTVNLEGLRFTKGVDIDLSGSIDPGGYALVVHDVAAFEMRYGTGLPVIGAWSGRLDNGGERLKLSFGAGVPIRDFVYDDESPWPVGADGSGPSLTLVDPFALPDHGDPFNWRVSLAPGGTPADTDGTTFAGGTPADLFAYATGDQPALMTRLPDGSPAFRIVLNQLAEDIRHHFEVSTDLIDWQPAPSPFQKVAVKPTTAGHALVTFAISPPSTGSTWFVRMKVESR